VGSYERTKRDKMRTDEIRGVLSGEMIPHGLKKNGEVMMGRDMNLEVGHAKVDR